LKITNPQQLCRLALCLATAFLAVEASAAVYELRMKAEGLKSPLANPVITASSSWTVEYGTQSMRIPAPNSSSSGAFQFTSGNPNVAAINGDWITFVNAGTTTLTAVQAATATHHAAQSTISLTVSKGEPNLQPFTIAPKTTVDGPFTLPVPSSASPGAVSYTSSNPAVATVSGTNVTIRGEGSVTITASQAETPNFTADAQTAVLVVSPPPLPAGYFKVGDLTWTAPYAGSLNYNAAVAYCSGTFNGQTGWRLSTVVEMRAANAARVMENFGGANSWNQSVGATFYYSQLGVTAYAGYDSSHGGHTLKVFCVK
jgi:hypothetical protein